MGVTGQRKSIAEFWVAGITYRTTDIATRSNFSVNPAHYIDILRIAKQNGLTELFILSTCNRTEIYGYAPQVRQLTALITAHHKSETTKCFHDIAYVMNGLEAVRHLFRVSAGLDSGILGDYEIVGQVKAAVSIARKAGFIGTFLDRLINTALQSAKAVRSETGISNGTVSVAFAAVQHIRSAFDDLSEKKVLLIGTGKIGRNASKSLLGIFPADGITVINRTASKAIALANEFGICHRPYSELDAAIKASDVVLVATNAEDPIITWPMLLGTGSKLMVDLSIPNNIAPDVASLPGISLINVDGLSKIKDETLEQRKAEVPQAEKIIDQHLEELQDWYGTRIILNTVQSKLQQLRSDYTSPALTETTLTQSDLSDKDMHAVIAGLAVNVKKDATVGCHCIAAFNAFIGASVV